MASDQEVRRSYALVFRDGTRKDFWAEDAAHALQLSRALLPRGRLAALIEDGDPLAEISYSADGFWAVAKPGGEPLPIR